MKILTASAALSLLLSAPAFGEEKPSAPTAPAQAAPTPAQPEKKKDEAKPPVLTLDAQKPDPSSGLYNVAPLAPGVGRPPGTLPNTANPGQPALPPHLLITPEGGQSVPLTTENSAPVAPGIYIASPYTGIVIVPGPIDAPMVRDPGPTPGKMPSPEPPLKLTPKTK